MSNYHAKTVHPMTGEVKDAFWMDDYFGRHRYGVRFEGEDTVFHESAITPTDDPYREIEALTAQRDKLVKALMEISDSLAAVADSIRISVSVALGEDV